MKTTAVRIRDLVCAMLLLFCGTMNAQTNCASQPAGLVHLWKGESNAHDSIGTSDGTTSGSVSYITAEVGKGFGFLNGAINFGANTANFGASDFTVEFWMKTSVQVSENYTMAVMEKWPACNATLAYWAIRMGGSGTGGKMRIEVSSAGGQGLQTLVATRMINDGNWHHVGFVRTNATISLFLDGVLDNQQIGTSTAVISNSTAFVVGQGVCSCCDGTQVFSGGIDELSIYNRGLSASEILSVFNAGTYGKCNGSAPFITQQPTSITAQTNSMVGFSVGATGTAPLSYQWSFNSSAISGATNSSYTISSVQLTDAGSYAVLVTNVFGSAQSSNAILTVTSGGGGGTGTNCASVLNGLIGWWPFESNLVDVTSTYNGTSSASGVSYTNGKVNLGLNLDGTPNAWADLGAFTNLGTSDFSVEFWIKTSTTDPSLRTELVGKRGYCDPYHSFFDVQMNPDGTISFNFGDTGVVGYMDFPSSATIADGVFHHVACVRQGTNAFIYIDGTLSGTQSAGDGQIASMSNTDDLRIGIGPCVPWNYSYFTGLLDELAIYNRALSPTDIQTIYSAGSYGKCTGGGSAPVITQQPTSLTVQSGSLVGFTVGATGSTPLFYQWSYNSNAISAATTSSLTLTNVHVVNSGTYSVVVANAFGSAQASATLTVTNGGGSGGASNCVTIPGLVNWWQGEGNALDSVGTNNGTLSGGTTYAVGEVGQTFNLSGSGGVIMDANVANFRTNDFTVEFWMKTGSTQPATVLGKRTVCNLGPAFDILIGYVNGTSYPNHIGFEMITANGAYSGVARNFTINDNRWHHVALVRLGTNTVMYIDGTLQAPSDLTPTSPVDVNNGSPFEVGPNPCYGPGGLAPYIGNLDELGIFNRALSTAEVQSIYNAGSSGKCGNSAANPAPVIYAQPTNVVAVVGSTVNLGLGVTGTQPMGYSWIFNGTNVYFTANSPLTITNVQLTNAGTYYVVVTNLYGSATSSNAVLTIGTIPTLTAQPQSQTALQFTPVTFNANATGTAPVAYQWQRNLVNIPQATNTSYTISSVQTTDAASYRVVVTNQLGSVTSTNAVLTVFTPNVRLENAAQTIGPVTVPLRMVAGGSENSVSVSVNWPSNNLIYASTILGSNAAGALLTVNTNQIASGRLGLGVFFVDASNFGIGTQELARITFRPGIVTNAVTNALTFGDVPVGRQVMDTNFNSLVTRYSNSVVTMPLTDYEGDVSPRTNGNHTMSVSDWTQAGRFVAGLDVVSNTLEFLRADCAPRTNGGDGRLSIADWVQAGRYAFGFDGIAAIGGPTNFTVAETPKLPTRPVSLVLLSQNGLTNVVAVHVSAQGDENALGFSLNFDPAQLGYVSTSLGSGASGSVLNVNSSQAASGRVGVALSLSPGNSFGTGDTEVARVTFVSSGFGLSYTAGVGFGD
ncbi:MAG: LamG-like jellyroll fold domain-containing protein, partial [Limisphaerales bacterium]